MNKVIYALVILASIAIGALSFSYLSSPKSLPEHALYYQTPREIDSFTFTDEKGNSFSKAQLNNKWSFIFLGYTSCPDVCPTTLQNLNFIYKDLIAIANNSQVMFVSADPQRDSVEKLSQYIAYFNPNFKALRAEHDVLFPFSRNLGLMYAITGESNENYGVDHSASIILINPNGQVAASFKPEHSIGSIPAIDNDKLLSDFKKIVALH